ncbi:Aspartyl protease family A22B [Phytophthora cinnamomi]|uniref:Aspartyl protease family A22B n=1 Tax=Phytophthora cinnamomi TaxID=4785 RepID=UPI00355A6BBC|nr:Aspartyl protease family A22B [Phytophthora cinnamomi]
MANFVQNGCYAALLAFILAPQLVVVPVSVQVVSAAVVVMFITSTLSLAVKLKLATGEDTVIIKGKGTFLFPLQVAGLQLLLCAFFTLLDKDPVKLVSTPYLAIVGVYTIAEAASPLLANLLFKGSTNAYTHIVKLPFYGVYKLELSTAWMLSFALASVFAVAWLSTKHYLLDNAFLILLIAKCTMLLAVGSLETSVVLVCNVLLSYSEPALSVLLPSAILSLSIRYDAHHANVVSSVAAFPTPSFRLNLLLYLFGLAAAMAAMFVLDAAQPTLQCVGPACLGLVLHFLVGPVFGSTSEDTSDKDASSVL